MFDIVDGATFAADIKARLAPAYKPRFTAVPWRDIGKAGIQHKYLVQGLLVQGEKSVIAGAPQAGKSFLATDLAISVARGVAFQGKRVNEPMGVVYVAAESGSGVINLRAPAYKKYFELDDEDLPLTFIVQSPDLFSADDDAKGLIADIKAYAASWKVPLGLVVIDTFSATTPGADENKAQDMTKVLQRIDQIREQTGAHVQIVHHMNAEGSKVRGHSSMIGNVDTVLVVALTEEHDKPDQGKPRVVRTMTTLKQKDGENGHLRKFILRVVDLGFDPEGEPVTSCVCTLPENFTEADLTTRWKEPGMYQLPGRKNAMMGFKALTEAFKNHGRNPPPHVAQKVPNGVDVITIGDWMREWVSLDDDKDVDIEVVKARVKGARKTLIELLLRDNIICKETEWVWRTKRRVQGFDRPLQRALNPGPDADERKGAVLEPRPDIDVADEFRF